jgi:hypothetical protein
LGGWFAVDRFGRLAVVLYKLVQSVTSAETKQKIPDRAQSEVDDDDGRMEWNASGSVGKENG